jgi:glycosyltransferase involved in cell wall biosynthesis
MHASTLAQRLRAEKVSPLLYFFLDGPMVSLAKEWDIEHRLIPWKFDMDFTLAWRLSRALKRERIDILHTHTITGNFYARWAMCLLSRRPLLVTTVHSFVIDEMKGATGVTVKDWLRYKREIYTKRFSRHFIAVSEKIRERVVENGIPAEKVTVIYNGVDVPEPEVIERHRESVRQEFAIRPEEVIIGIVGRLVPLKNHSFFLRLAKKLSGKFPHLKFLIVGDGVLLQDLKRESGELGIDDRIIFTGWRNDNVRLISALDVLVLCSEIEGLNMSLLEAMACGKSVVGSRVDGIVDAVLDGETGFLATVNDMDMFSARLEPLIADKVLRETTGRKAREIVKRKYSLELMVQKTAELYERLQRETDG